jgi:hypothetical protein
MLDAEEGDYGEFEDDFSGRSVADDDASDEEEVQDATFLFGKRPPETCNGQGNGKKRKGAWQGNGRRESKSRYNERVKSPRGGHSLSYQHFDRGTKTACLLLQAIVPTSALFDKITASFQDTGNFS